MSLLFCDNCGEQVYQTAKYGKVNGFVCMVCRRPIIPNITQRYSREMWPFIHSDNLNPQCPGNRDNLVQHEWPGKDEAVHTSIGEEFLIGRLFDTKHEGYVTTLVFEDDNEAAEWLTQYPDGRVFNAAIIVGQELEYVKPTSGHFRPKVPSDG